MNPCLSLSIPLSVNVSINYRFFAHVYYSAKDAGARNLIEKMVAADVLRAVNKAYYSGAVLSVPCGNVINVYA